MVSFKYFLLAAAAVVGVVAQDDSDASAAAAWAQISSGDDTLAIGDTSLKRSVTGRNNPGTSMGDPYAGDCCTAKYTLPPCETTCNRNNCFRGFLNFREGSDGKHCPINAFAFCCAWNWLKPAYKLWAVKTGALYKLAPYSANCCSPGDKPQDVVDKVNDVCGCTLNHEVTIDKSSDYYQAKCYGPYDKHCKSKK